MEHKTTYGDFQSDHFQSYLKDYEESIQNTSFWINEAKRLDWPIFQLRV